MPLNIVIPDAGSELPADLDERVDAVEEGLVSETQDRELGDMLLGEQITDLSEAIENAVGPKLFHVHPQGDPLADWPIQHDLNFMPSGIEVTDSGGSRHRPEWVEHIDNNNLILHFRFAFGGTARLS